jgi:hypothetical protein
VSVIASSKGQIPQCKIEFGPLNTVFDGLVDEPQKLSEASEKN